MLNSIFLCYNILGDIMKKILICCSLLLVIFLVGCGKSNEGKEEKKEETKYMTGKHNIEIDIEEYGKIKLELDADVAPITVTNFINLVNEKFYDGLTFHRIISGFMIQGGDGNGSRETPNKIKGEFSANGVRNNISHKRGVISMARATSYDSASSQFFIVHEESLFLDGNYAGFGHVTDGIEVVDAICKKVKVEDNNGTVSSKNQPKIKTIRVID